MKKKENISFYHVHRNVLHNLTVSHIIWAYIGLRAVSELSRTFLHVG